MNPRVASFFLLLACTASADEIDRYIEAGMRDMHLPGVALAVVRDGEIIKAKGYGFANLASKTPVTPESVFEIGSLTKQLTAAAIMFLVEDGKLALDEKLSRYLPGTPAAWDAITIRHLLTHTSGIQNYLDVPDFPDIHRAGLSHDEITKLFFERLKLEFAPGETWSYSNSGYLLLGNIIEKVSGQSYWDFLRERIFAPLGMNATHSTDPKSAMEKRARGYEWHDGKYEERPALAENAYAAGAIVSTVGDLSKWDAAVRTEKLLRPASLEAMWTPQKTSSGETAPFNYGFGWWIDRYHGHRVIYHSGGTPGFSSILYRFVDDNITVIVLSNHADRVIDHVAVDLAANYVPGLVRRTTSDSEPETTKKLRNALVNLIAGKADPAQFTSPMQMFLQTATGKNVWPWVGSDGELKSFEFSESETNGDERILRYKAVLGGVTRWFSFTLAADGKIAQINWW